MKRWVGWSPLILGAGVLMLLSGGPHGTPDGLTPVQIRILVAVETAPRPPVFCWSKETDPRVAQAFSPPDGFEGTSLYDFQDENHWARTATDGSGLGRGDPITLTWGILPDNVYIPGSGEPGAVSRAILMLDNIYGAGPGGSDLTQRPWFPLFQEAFDSWAREIGVRYVYEPNDDGAPFPDSPGVLGVRPDVRIGAHSVDGNLGANIYAYNFFPDLGDMVIDSDNDPTFRSDKNNGNILFENLVSHEHGHGLGLGHSCPVEQTKLMEPIITTKFTGPQHDDILGGNRGYGDRLEFPVRNDNPAAATDLGPVTPGDTLREANLSIDGLSDHDFLAFGVPEGSRLSVTVTPVGFSYFNSPELAGGECPLGWFFNSRIQNDLGFEIRGRSGANVLGGAAYLPAGQPESVTDLLLPEGAGTYFLHVFGDTTETQLYDLEVTVNQGQPPVAACKDVTTCNGNVSVFRFDDGSFDPDGDTITYATDPEGPFAPGATPVQFIVSDGVFADTCQATITVNRPPVAVAGPLQVMADSSQGCMATVDPASLDQGSSDPDGDALSFGLVPSGPYAEGVNPVVFIATDRCGVSDSVSTTLTVTCTTPVRLLSFAAARDGERGILTWEVADAFDHAGFHVHRAEAGGARTRLTSSLLRGRTGYRFVDDDAPAGEADYWLEEVSRGGESTWFGPRILPAADLGRPLALRAASNPIRGGTRIEYGLPEEAEVSLAVFDTRGRRVRSLDHGFQGPGTHEVTWDARNDAGERLAAGLYLVRLQVGADTRVLKVVLAP